MKGFFLLVLILLSLQPYAQIGIGDNGIVDIRLVAKNKETGEIIPYVVFKVAIDGKETALVPNRPPKDTYFKICPKKAIIKTFVFSAYGYNCDTVQQSLYFRIIEDTTLYFELSPRSSNTVSIDDYQKFQTDMCAQSPICDWKHPASVESRIYYEHCDGRIARLSEIDENEMLLGSWELLRNTNGIIPICPSGQCEQSDSVMYVSPNGDTIVPYGEMEYLGYGIISDYGIVRKLYSDGTSKWIGINNKGEYLFDVYFFDNGPDYTVEGRFRIIKNGKIGFANEKGEIVVEPQFECADYFREGKARVTFDCTLVPSGEYKTMKSDTWLHIDLDGNIVE